MIDSRHVTLIAMARLALLNIADAERALVDGDVATAKAHLAFAVSELELGLHPTQRLRNDGSGRHIYGRRH